MKRYEVVVVDYRWVTMTVEAEDLMGAIRVVEGKTLDEVVKMGGVVSEESGTALRSVNEVDGESRRTAITACQAAAPPVSPPRMPRRYKPRKAKALAPGPQGATPPAVVQGPAAGSEKCGNPECTNPRPAKVEGSKGKRPEYCSTRCRSRAGYLRKKVAGAKGGQAAG